jgi:hypothetical protein
MKTNDRSPICRLRNGIALSVAALALTATAAPASAAYILDPTLPGQYAAGTGANATFLSIDGNWKDSAVYWNESAKKFKNFTQGQNANGGYQPVGTFDWGTGIWGLSDWNTINNSGSGNAPSVPVVHSWKGTVSTINQGDKEWNACAADEKTCGRFGVTADALPADFFKGEAHQDNWTSHYTGYIRITDPGEYNFGVLYDDGFFLNIWGANGSFARISSDFLSPRDRLGFGQNLYMTPGLYEFELGAYDRLEVGVVNLSWWLNGKWSTVPTANLVTNPTALETPGPIPVPTPGTAPLLLAALAAFAAVRMKRKRG